MGIRSKFFIVIGPLMLIMVLFVYIVISGRFLDQFLEIEADLAEQNVDRALDAISGSLEDVNTKSTDWAQWDDSYVFMQDHNQEYWQSNLSNDATLEGMKLSAMVFVDTSGNVVATKNILDNNKESDSIPQTILDEVLTDKFVDYSENGPTFHKGIIHVDGKVFLVASRHIIRTDGTGPTTGTLIFMRVVDIVLINDISKRIHLPLEIYTSIDLLPLDDQQKKVLSDDKSEGSDDLVRVEGDRVAAYGAVHDVFEKHAIFTRIEMPRTIYEHGQSAIHFFSVFFVATFAVFSVILMFLLEKLVFTPISKLSTDVDRIRSSNDEALRIAVSGNDQFSHLGETINQMIDSLYKMREQKEESENRFQAVADLAPVMIWMTDANKRTTYLNKRWFDFTGKTIEEELAEGWEKDIHPDDAERCMKAYATAFDAKASFYLEYRLKNAKGEYKWVLGNGVPNFDSDGTFVGYLGTCIDITERKNAEELNNKRVADMETLNKMMVSRELKMIELKKELQRLKASE